MLLGIVLETFSHVAGWWKDQCITPMSWGDLGINIGDVGAGWGTG